MLAVRWARRAGPSAGQAAHVREALAKVLRVPADYIRLRE